MNKQNIFFTMLLILATGLAIGLLKKFSTITAVPVQTKILHDLDEKRIAIPESKNANTLKIEKTEQKNPAEQTVEDYERENLSTSDEVIKIKITNIHSIITSQNLIDKANSQQLSTVETKLLRNSLRLKSALHKILTDRKIKKLKENI